MQETIAINRDWVNSNACRLSHDIRVVSHSFITFNTGNTKTGTLAKNENSNEMPYYAAFY